MYTWPQAPQQSSTDTLDKDFSMRDQKQICTLKISTLFSWHASKCDELTFHFPRSWILSTVVIFPSRFLGTQGKNAHHLHYIQVHFWAKKLGLASHYLVKLADNCVWLHLLLGRPGRKTQAWCSREPPSNQPSMLPGSTVEAASSSGSPAELLATGGFPHIFCPLNFPQFFSLFSLSFLVLVSKHLFSFIT